MSRLTESEEKNKFEIGESYTFSDMESGLRSTGLQIQKMDDKRVFVVYKDKEERTLRYLFEHMIGNTYLLRDICEKNQAYICAYVEHV